MPLNSHFWEEYLPDFEKLSLLKPCKLIIEKFVVTCYQIVTTSCSKYVS